MNLSPKDRDELTYNPIGWDTFIASMYRGMRDGVIEVVALAPQGVDVYPRMRIMWRPLPYYRNTGDASSAFSEALALNVMRGYGVYFGVGARKQAIAPEQAVDKKTGEIYTKQRRGKKSDVYAIPGLWAEVDNPDTDALPQLMWAIGLPPTIIVGSGGGWHGYWLFDEPLYVNENNADSIDRALHALAVAAGADTHSAELARILRLPDTINTKPERNGVRCEVLAAYGHRYRARTLFHELRRFMPQPTVRPTRSIPTEAAQQLPNWVQEFLQHGAPQGNRNQTLFRVACCYRDAGIAQSTCEQQAGAVVIGGDFSEEEATRTIDSAYRRQANPAVNRQVSSRMGFGDKLRKARNSHE